MWGGFGGPWGGFGPRGGGFGCGFGGGGYPAYATLFVLLAISRGGFFW